MHGLDPGTAELELDTQVEVRRVDADEHVRALGDKGLDQAFAARQQLGQAPQHFHQAHDRQALHGEVGVQPFGLHARAANADELGVGMSRLERLHQGGAEDIAGRLAGDQRDAQGTIHGDQRVMPRVEDWMESRKTATSGNWSEDSARSARACSTVSPWR
ncbi:hypothetical protein D3C81_1729450 [compost metagenome]